MGYGYRVFVFNQSGELRRISNKMFDEFYSGKGSLPGFSGDKVKLAYVILNFVKREPKKILGIVGHFWKTDKSGFLDGEWRDSMREAVMSSPYSPFGEKAESEGAIIKASPKFAKRAADRFRWKPTPREFNAITKAIWPTQKKNRRRKHKKVVKIDSYRR